MTSLLALLAAVILLSYFFVVYGLELQKRAIALLPHRHQKRVTADILQTIETELSRYVLTITTINIVLGALVAAVLVALGIPLGDALLWGALAGLFNYAPYVGPLVGTIMLALVGVVGFDDPQRMALPPLCYLGLQLLESQVLTPIILGRRWSISPRPSRWLWESPRSSGRNTPTSTRTIRSSTITCTSTTSTTATRTRDRSASRTRIRIATRRSPTRTPTSPTRTTVIRTGSAGTGATRAGAARAASEAFPADRAPPRAPCAGPLASVRRAAAKQ